MTTRLHPDADRWDEEPGKWKTHPFLEGLSPEHLATLTECAMPTGFAADEIIFREGEMANRFYLILEGCVVLETRTPDGLSVKADAITTGDVLGWSWLFPPYAWNFTARASSSVRASTKSIRRASCASGPAD